MFHFLSFAIFRCRLWKSALEKSFLAKFKSVPKALHAGIQSRAASGIARGTDAAGPDVVTAAGEEVGINLLPMMITPGVF